MFIRNGQYMNGMIIDRTTGKFSSMVKAGKFGRLIIKVEVLNIRKGD